MKKKAAFLACCFLAGPLAAVAQTAPSTLPRKVTVYLTAAGQQLPTADGADHRADITMRDSISGMMRE